MDSAEAVGQKAEPMHTRGGFWSLPPGLRIAPLNLVLIAIALFTAIPRVILGATQYVEYDGYWHIFIAQQDRWRNFLWDYRVNAHPPLYYFALRAALWFGHSLLAYRAVSLITGIASVYLIGRLAAKMLSSPLIAALAALAFGLALPSIIISCEVRQYMLCVFFVLVSYSYFLDLLTSKETGAATKKRALFAIAAALACLSHYCAVFYLVALFLIAVLLIPIRQPRPWWRAASREVATFGPVFGIICYEYVRHFGTRGMPWNHLMEFYYQPGGPESLREYILRNLQNTLNLFSPWPVQSHPLALAILAALLVLGLVTLYLVRRAKEPKNLFAIATVLAPALMLAGIMLAGALSKYPFGGFLRQQFVLFPFLVLCAFLLFDRAGYGNAAPRGVRIDNGICHRNRGLGYSNVRGLSKSAAQA